MVNAAMENPKKHGTGLWDYEEVPYNDTGDWAPNSQEHIAISSDEERHVRKKAKKLKKTEKPETRKKKPEARTTCTITIDDDLEGEEDDFLILPCKDDKKHAAPSAGPLPKEKSAAVRPGEPEAALSLEASEAIQKCRKIQEQMKSLQDECKDDYLEGPTSNGTLRAWDSMQLPARSLGILKRYHATAGDCDSPPILGAADKELLAEDARQQQMLHSLGACLQSDLNAAAEDPEKIKVVCQCKRSGHIERVEIKLRSTDEMSKLQAAFLKIAAGKGWVKSADIPPAGFKLSFDGDRIDLKNQPEGLGIEDGDAIDISWKDCK